MDGIQDGLKEGLAVPVNNPVWVTNQPDKARENKPPQCAQGNRTGKIRSHCSRIDQQSCHVIYLDSLELD